MQATISEIGQAAGTLRAFCDDEPAPEADFAWRALEEIDYGLILVKPDCSLHHANHLARHELARARFLRVAGDRVVGQTPTQSDEILRAVTAAAQGRRQMLMLRSDNDTLPVACVPLFQPYEASGGSVLLMLGRQPGIQNLNVTFFSRTHGLTPTEEAVLRALCEGLEVQDSAEAHGVSVCTVRTQVRSLRLKTGIGSMRLLVQRVASLPPMVPMSLTLRSPAPAQSGV
jgi:DNA-binding CsgD family transcriptional regulator